MQAIIIRRVLLMIPLGIGMTLIAFVVSHSVPADPVAAHLGQRSMEDPAIVAAFRASGNMLMAMVIALVSQWMFQFPLAYVLSKHTVLQAAGLWWSFPIANIGVAIVSVCWFAHGGWKKTRLTEESRQVAKVVVVPGRLVNIVTSS